MKFRVKRTSEWTPHPDKPLAPGVEWGDFEERTYYTYDSLSKARADKHNAGREYQMHNGRVTSPPRTVHGWFVEIDNLDDLMAFRSAAGGHPLIIDTDDEGHYTVEIYDDYRE